MPHKGVSLVVGAVVLAVAAAWFDQATAQVDRIHRHVAPPLVQALCNVVGATCCARDTVVKTEHCHKGLGCDIASRRAKPVAVQARPAAMVISPVFR